VSWRKQLERIIEAVPNGLIIIDRNGQIIFANAVAEKIAGVPRSFLMGKAYNSFKVTTVDGAAFPDEKLPYAQVIKTGRPVFDIEFAVEHPNGKIVILSTNAALLRDEKGEIVYVILSFADITERKRSEEFLEKYRLLFETTGNIVLFIRRRDGRIIDANAAAVSAYGYSYEELLSSTIYNLRVPETLPQIEEQMEEALTRGILFETIHRRKDGSTFSVEVSSKGAEIGGESLLISIIRDTTERKKTEEERERLLKELNFLLQITDIAISTLNLDELLDGILNRLFATMRADAATILLMEDNRLRAYTTIGLEDEVRQEFSLQIGEGFAGTVAETLQPLYIEDAQVNKLVVSPTIKKIGIRSMLGVPMIVDYNLVGVLHVDWQNIHPKDENEVHLLKIAADRIALAISNAKLYRTTEEAKRLSDALNEINATISSTLDIDEIMQRVVVDAAKVIGCETSAIDTKDGDELVVRYVYKFPEEAVGARFKPEDVPFVELLEKERRIVVIDNSFTDPRVNPEVQKKYNVRSVMVVPLTMRDKLFGALFFNYHTQLHTFSESEIDFARKLGVSVSLAFENARLYEEERRIADTLQKALLAIPEKVDHLEYGVLYHSATEAAQVGGDFYDLFELEHDRVGLIIGDVAGKGLEAAALTAVVKNTIRAYALEGYDPAGIIAKTNTVVRGVSAPSTFVTVFFAIFDKNTRKLVYCNAGHPPAIIKRKPQTVELFEVYSPIIGAFAGLRYENGETVLGIGDTMILYTDGIIEARHDREFFEEERLVEFIRELGPVSAKEVPRVIFDEVLRFSDGRLTDDVALLALAYTGKQAA